MFNDSLLYNVSLGKLAKGELASEAEVRQALEQASLSDFVKRQPKGLETVVGERGLRLSGGEKARNRAERRAGNAHFGTLTHHLFCSNVSPSRARC